MMLQRIGRIVGRADQHDVHLPHDAAGGELGLGELGVALAPNALGRVGAQQPVADAQRPLQFQVRPVVQRVAERLRHGLGPLLELLPIRGVAGAIALRHAGRPHRPPLVVIAGKPDLRQILEAAVLGHLGGRKMAVVVDDRQIAGIAMIQVPPRGRSAAGSSR